MKVVIFGGAGYLGSVLTPLLLDKGHQVTVYDNFLFGAEPLAAVKGHPGLRVVDGDIRNLALASQTLNGQNAAILLAGLVGGPACDLNPDETVAVNYLAPAALVAAARYRGLERFIFASTDSCYGAQEKVDLNEDSPLKPLSLYADLKARCEDLILRAAAPGFYPTILRMATIYGLSPRMRFDLIINILTREAVVKGLARIFSGEQWRPLVHVKDAAKAYALALDAEAEKVGGRIFNVGSNHQNVQFKDLGPMITDAMPGAKIETVPQPPDLRDYHVNFDRIKSELGFRPDFELADGIAEMRAALTGGSITDPYLPVYHNS